MRGATFRVRRPEPGPQIQGGSTPFPHEIDDALKARLSALIAEGWALWERFDREVRERQFHPFIASDYEAVLRGLVAFRAPGLRFLEWGSATGIITIMADLLGYDACGIEIDGDLVATARALAQKHQSGARFVSGSFFPAGYRWQPRDGDARTGTLGSGQSGYLQLGLALDDFDVVFGYPWGGEEPVMLDLMKQYGRPDAVLLMFGVNDGLRAYRGGTRLTLPAP